MTYGIVATPMSLSDVQGRAPNESLLRCNCSYICVADVKISSHIAVARFLCDNSASCLTVVSDIAVFVLNSNQPTNRLV